MSSLRTRLIRLAAETPALRDDLLPLLKMARPESPVEQAVWAAWMMFDGNDPRRDYLPRVSGVGLSAVVSDEALEDIQVEKLAKKLEKAAKSMERQSRSWRTAYNLIREGRIDLDGRRLAKDMMKTLAKIKLVHKDMTKLRPLIADEYLQERIDEALKKSTETQRAFDKAIREAQKA